jgi:hypothetical protein
MNSLLRASSFSAVAAVIAFGAFACSSSTNQGQGTLDGGGGGGEAGIGPEGDGGGGGDGSGGGEGGGDGGAATPRGTILLTQARVGGNPNYSFSAAFLAPEAPTSMGTTAPTVTTMGDCTATQIPVDPNAVAPKGRSGLNAGAITLAGTGTPASTMLVYGPIASSGFSNYPPAMGNTAIFAGGDTFTLSGAGGADLPSFAAQTLVTPSEIVVTAPACAGTCPDLNRTMDLPVTWTGGGAGKVVVTFETIATSQVVLLQCKFAATGGSGTVPAALLGKLDKAGDPDVSGVVIISAANVVDFVVGNAPTTFTVQASALESSLTVSN